MILRLLIVLILLAPALHLEADAGRSEIVRGGTLTIDAYLFNDGDTQTTASIAVTAPPGFELIDVSQASGEIPPGRAAHATFRYLVLPTAPLGLASFVVRSGILSALVTVRVGPIEWPPPWRKVWMPVARAAIADGAGAGVMASQKCHPASRCCAGGLTHARSPG